MGYVPKNHPSNAEEEIPPFNMAQVPEDDEDVIAQDEVLPPPPSVGDNLVLPRIILGCAPFGYGVYADEASVRSTMPVRLVRAALRAGVNAFDTAPHYHPSEIILGHALAALRDEFPRDSYAIITKAGKYGPQVRDHDYDPKTIVASVERSLRRLQTDYLDVVYLHDCEFVATGVEPAGAQGEPTPSAWASYGVQPSSPPVGQGDERVLAALLALRELKKQGKIRHVGLAGYPLPVLLRLCMLVLNRTGEPVDVVQTYAHQTVLCSTLNEGYVDAFTKNAHVRQVVNAAPLAMGILTAGGGPDWHPGKNIPKLYDATREAVDVARAAGSSIEDVACAFGYRTVTQDNGAVVPVVIGCTNLAQLHLTLRAFSLAYNNREDAKCVQAEKDVLALFRERGVHNWSWQSPAPEHDLSHKED